MKKLCIILPMLLVSVLKTQTIKDCRQRFQKYLNFRGQISNQIVFNDTSFTLASTGAGRITIYQSELQVLSEFMQRSGVKDQAKLLSNKGNRMLRKFTLDSLKKLSQPNTLSGRQGSGLRQKRIAIDPGHFGINLTDAASEQKFLHFKTAKGGDSVLLFESALTFATAHIVKKMLEEQGAIVMLTRQEAGNTSFGCTYAAWLKQNKKRTLDSLHANGSMNTAKYSKLLKTNNHDFFWSFFRDYDLANRAKLINQFKPDVSVVIHYNVDEKNAPWKATSKKNFTMVFIGGAFSGGDLDNESNRMDFLRLLITNQLNRSDSLSAITVKNFNLNLGIPIARPQDAEYLAKNCNVSGFSGVYCRNLVLCRKINSPLVYGEALYQDNENECFELMKTNVESYGIKTNARIVAAARSYYEAVAKFFR